MAFEFINKLPTPAEIKEQFPLPAEFIVHKAERDEEVKKVISGESDKFLVIIGPCSADNEDAVLDYTSRLIASCCVSDSVWLSCEIAVASAGSLF